MDNAESITSVVIGVLLPILISFIKVVKWNRVAKIVLSAGLSLILAVAIHLVSNFNEGFDFQVLANWGVIFGTASTIYATIFEKSGLEKRLRGE